jgi:hypothetical protein
VVGPVIAQAKPAIHHPILFGQDDPVHPLDLSNLYFSVATDGNIPRKMSRPNPKLS